MGLPLVALGVSVFRVWGLGVLGKLPEIPLLPRLMQAPAGVLVQDPSFGVQGTLRHRGSGFRVYRL